MAFAANMAAAILLMLFGPYASCAPSGYLDPWFYTGYFTHFSYLVHTYGVTYYVSRLPWILPGLAFFHVFPPAAADLLLHTLTLAAGGTALYLTVSRLYGAFPAALACAMLMTNPYYVAAIFWDYPDGPAVAYSLVSLSFFFRPTGGRISNAAWGGLFLALAGYTNLASLPALIGMAAIPLWRHRRKWDELWLAIRDLFAAGIAVTAVLAIPGKLLLNYYQVLVPQIYRTIVTAKDPVFLDDYRRFGNSWIPGAYRLYPPLLLLIAGAGFCIFHREIRSAVREAYIALLITCLLFFIAQWRFGAVSLQVEYQSSYILAPLMALAGFLLGECFSTARAAKSRSTQNLTMALTGLGVAAPLLASPILHSRPLGWIGLAILGVAMTACLLAMRADRALVASACGFLLPVTLFAACAADGTLSNVWQKQRNAGVFDSLMRAEAAIDGSRHGRRVRFWYEPAGPAAGFYDSLCSLYLRDRFDLNAQWIAAHPASVQELRHSPTAIVHLVQDAGTVAERQAMLASAGITLENARQWKIASPDGEFYVVMEDVRM